MVDGAMRLGIKLTTSQICQFKIYSDELLKWNKKINLTRITNAKQIIIKHFLDSLIYLKGIEKPSECKLLDIGSGAGFPGVPIKIAIPDIKLSLMDAQFKRIAFLTRLCSLLNIRNINYIHDRAEAKNTADLNKYNIVTVRALSALKKVIPLAFIYLRPGGRLIVSYGLQLKQQIGSIEDVLDEYNGALQNIIKVKLPYNNELRNVIIIRKSFT